MDAMRLRSLVGKRVLFQFDSGSQAIGTLARCLPDAGAVHLVELERVALISREGVLLRELDAYPFIPATPVGATEV
jgi:hypothetical protein